MGSFCPVAGKRHLHRCYSFAELLQETAVKSLHHSCRSELTRQGISLGCSSRFPKRPDFTLIDLDSSVWQERGPSPRPTESDERPTPSPRERAETNRNL